MKKTYGLIVLAIFNIFIALFLGQIFYYTSIDLKIKIMVGMMLALILLYIDASVLHLLMKRVKKTLPEKKKKRAVQKLKRKKHICNLVLSIFCIVLGLGNYFYFQANQMLSVITNAMEQTNLHYNVYVSKDSEIVSLNDEAIIDIGFDSESNSLLTSTLSNQYQRICYVDYNPLYINSHYGLYEQLKNENVDAIIIEESTETLLKNTYPHFESDTKLIESITIPTSVDSSPVNIKKEAFNVLIMGVDIREDEGDIHSKTRTDTLMLATFNPNTMKLSLISIPRDSYVPFGEPCEGIEDKITHAALEGVGCSVKTVEQLLDIEVNYYAKFNFNALVQLVDAIGGVEVDVKYSFTEQDSDDVKDAISIEKGLQTLDGEEALAYARHRKTQNDHVRNASQQQVLKAILSKLASVDVFSHLDDLFKVMKDNMTTNFNRSEMMKLVTLIPRLKNLQMSNMVMEGEDLEAYVSRYDQVLWITELDDTSIQKAKDLIQEISNNK